MGRQCRGTDGSSPLARGLPQGPCGRLTGAGIIPARAGFTVLFVRLFDVVGDHPRSRGVYAGSVQCGASTRGSSPLARGLHPRRRPTGRGMWIIPARAGFTPGRLQDGAADGDHPRSRGVYAGSVQCGASTRGSSPLARGLHPRRRPTGRGMWIIPARAGFTPGRLQDGAADGDHPRSRGVYAGSVQCGASTRGSSPLARGLHPRRRPTGRGMWIIPARAGFTPGRLQDGAADGDHPRSRGVYRYQDLSADPVLGSSPLARGLLTTNIDHLMDKGIIPARAGFTLALLLRLHRPGDHPRSRGVYRAWRRRARAGRWIIPARAGFTHPHAARGR